MGQVNWGIIGLGAVATQFAKGFKDISSAKLLAISSRHVDKLNKFKEEFKIDKNYCFNDYKNLIGNKDVDIVYIALPTSLHHEWIINCLDAGKKVLVEKPATMNALEIEVIKKRYIDKNFFLCEAFMYMYHPQIKKTIDLITQGEIGEIISIESNFGSDILSKKNLFGFKKKKKINYKKRIFNKQLGGGVILDLGCYPVSLSNLIASLNLKINYDKVKILNIRKEKVSDDIEIDSSIELTYENNFRASLNVSYSKNIGRKTCIVGTQGELTLEDTWSGESSTIIIKNDRNRVINTGSTENIYSYEINFLSNCISNNKLRPIFPGLTIDSIIGNMKILDKWKN